MARASLETEAPAKEGGNQKIKLIVAVVALLAAGVTIAWSFGAFDNPNKALPVQPPVVETIPEAERQEFIKYQEKKVEEAAKRPPPSGS